MERAAGPGATVEGDRGRVVEVEVEGCGRGRGVGERVCVGR